MSATTQQFVAASAAPPLKKHSASAAGTKNFAQRHRLAASEILTGTFMSFTHCRAWLYLNMSLTPEDQFAARVL
jgi:hypothetical protein